MTIPIVETLAPQVATEVKALADRINNAFYTANEHAGKAMAKYIEVGSLLSVARDKFQGDLEYGRWRAENTTLSKSWATKLVKVYRTYGDDVPKNLSFSALAELANAPEEVREVVEEKAASEEEKTPSVREIRQQVRDAKFDEMEALEAEEKGEPKPEPDLASLSPEEAVQIQINQPHMKRVNNWIQLEKKTVNDAFILLGLPPFFDGTPNIETIRALGMAILGDVSHPAVKLIEKELY